MTPDTLRSIVDDGLFAEVWARLSQGERDEIQRATGDEFSRRYRNVMGEIRGASSYNTKPDAEGPKTDTWPEPVGAEAYNGLAGEIVRALLPHSEADPAALLVQVLVAFGTLVGRGPHVRVEGDQHHANIFAVVVGPTSKGRKGTSWGRVRSIFEMLQDWPSVVDGLSSGEGLKWAVRDTRFQSNNDGELEQVDPGVMDKRLLVVEPEFSQVLRQTARAGNTLSATIRSAWDTGRLATLTKNDPVTATGAHISIVGHVTADELRAEMTATDQANGFANRFIYVCATRSKKLPFGGGEIPQEILAGFARQLETAAADARRLSSISMTPAARAAWVRLYDHLSEGYPGLFGAVTGRAEAQTLRLALIFALIDRAAEIDERHLAAATAVWEHAEDSARYVFGSAVGDRVADEIVRALQAAGPVGMTRTEICDLFKRHRTAERISAALELIEQRRLASRSRTQTTGRPAEIWKCSRHEA